MRRRRFVALLAIAGAWIGTFGAAGAAAHITDFVRLSGAEVVPGPGDTDGAGAAFVDLKPAHEQVCVAVRHSDIDSVSAVHVHSGAVGVAGPVVIDLTPTLSGPPCVSVPLARIRDIRSDPSSHYLDVHTASAPDEAIRGQLDRSLTESTLPQATGPTHLFGRMSGALERPGPGDPDGRGAVFVDIRVATGTICVDERHAAIDDPSAMHIHRRGAGTPGPVVIDVSAALVSGGRCVSAPVAVLRRIRDRPRIFYCNIHTPSFPDGAIRGQLVESS